MSILHTSTFPSLTQPNMAEWYGDHTTSYTGVCISEWYGDHTTSYTGVYISEWYGDHTTSYTGAYISEWYGDHTTSWYIHSTVVHVVHICTLVLEKLCSGVLWFWCHSFTLQSALQLTNTSLTNGDHLTRYTASCGHGDTWTASIQ